MQVRQEVARGEYMVPIGFGHQGGRVTFVLKEAGLEGFGSDKLMVVALTLGGH